MIERTPTPRGNVSRETSAGTAKAMDPAQRAEKARQLRRAVAMDPADHQEAHSPTEAVRVRFDAPRRVTIEVCRRRIVDARLWDAMSEDQQGAAERIYRGFEAITGPVASKIASMERVDGGGGSAIPERLAGLIEDYWTWAKRAQRERLRVAEMLDVLIFGKSCAQVDRERRQRRHTARRNLFDGLELYCRIKGWAGRLAG